MSITHTVIIVTDETVLSWLSCGTAEEAEAQAKAFAEAQELPNPIFVVKRGHIIF